MASGDRSGHTGIRYQPDERPPHLLSAGMGVQAAMLVLAGIVLTPAIVIRAADQDETYMTWAIFAALVVSGTTTVLQAVRLGRIGSGHVLIMGTSGAFIAVCVAALVEGGPALLATLVIVSSLFQFALSARLSLLRRILTPVVSGTVIMLIAVTIMPIAFDMLADVPEGTPPAAAPVTAGVTLVAVAALGLRATGTWRLWSPVVGIVVGCGVASLFGLYEVERIASSPWVGLPAGGWQGFEWNLGASFWALLPAFVFVTLVGAIETIGDAVAIQRVSWRSERAVDFRTVQGAVAADGVGNLLSGIAGTVPNTTYSSSVPLAEMTGVASRNVGVYIGVVLAILAFMPKMTALPLTIPNPVAAAYLTMLLALLFIQGMRIVVQDGIDYRKATVAGLGFWIGTGFPEQGDFRRLPRRNLGGAFGERHDHRRPGRHRSDPVHGADQPAPAAHRNGAGTRRRARGGGVPARVRRPSRLERDGRRAPVPGRGGDVVEPRDAGGGGRSRAEAAPAPFRQPRRERPRAGVRGRNRGREHRGHDGAAGGTGRGPRRARAFAAPACGTWPRRCATSSTTTPTSSPCASKGKADSQKGDRRVARRHIEPRTSKGQPPAGRAPDRTPKPLREGRRAGR